MLPHIYSPCSIREVFRLCCDVTSQPKKAFLKTLARHCTDQADREALMAFTTPAGRADYEALIRTRPNLLELLEAFPSAMPPLEALLDGLPALMPRYYSVTSSPSVFPTCMHFAITIVDNELPPW